MKEITPNLFILGAAKCGSTSLYGYLVQHPDIFLTRVKEPHFFDNDLRYQKGLEWYLKEFYGNAGNTRYTGEATPGYFHKYEKVIPRLASCVDKRKTRFIVVLRDPVDRAWSHYLHRVRNNKEQENFETALRMEDARLEKDKNEWVGYFNDGLYAHQLSRWFEHFDRDNFYFILSDELKTSPDVVLRDLFCWLGVAERPVQTGLSSNRASRPRSRLVHKLIKNPPTLIKWLLSPLRFAGFSNLLLFRSYFLRLNLKALGKTDPSKSVAPAPATLKMLRTRYQQDILLLEKLIGRNLSAWREKQL